jgi:hypothetical protein
MVDFLLLNTFPPDDVLLLNTALSQDLIVDKRNSSHSESSAKLERSDDGDIICLTPQGSRCVASKKG